MSTILHQQRKEEMLKPLQMIKRIISEPSPVDLDNMIHLPSDIHRKISGHYSSIIPESHGLRVRDWLNEKDFEFQYKYGRKILEEYGF